MCSVFPPVLPPADGSKLVGYFWGQETRPFFRQPTRVRLLFCGFPAAETFMLSNLLFTLWVQDCAEHKHRVMTAIQTPTKMICEGPAGEEKT